MPSSVITQERLDANEAAAAFPSDSAATADQLTHQGFREGYVRIWGSTSNYATMAVLSFGNVAQAAAFRDFERSSMAGAVNTYVTSHPAIPGSFVFVITSATKQSVSNDPVFCDGVWFALQDYAFESLACGATPNWATQVERVAQAEYSRAMGQLGAR